MTQPRPARNSTLWIAFLIPVLVLACLLNAARSEQIAFTQTQLRGVEYEKPLLGLLGKVSDYQLLALRKESGAEVESDMAAQATAIDTELKALAAQDAEPYPSAEALVKSWQALKTAAEYSSESYNGIRTLLVGLILDTGEAFHLLEGGDLATHYLAASVVSTAPSTLQAIALLNSKVYIALNNHEGVIPPENTAALATEAALLRIALAPRVEQDVTHAMRTPQLKQALEPLAEEFTAKRSAFEGTVNALLAGEEMDAAAYMEVGSGFHASMAALAAESLASLQEALEARQDSLRETRMTLLGIALAAVLFGLFLLRRATSGVSHAANRQACEQFDSQLKPVMDDVTRAAAELQQAADRVTGLSRDSALPESSIAGPAETSAQAAKSAEKLHGGLGRVQLLAQQVKETSVTGAADAATLTDAVAALEETSGRAGEVRASLGSLANQINLLALNAAIESARAGEAGKGFASVAADIKTIAHQTAQANEALAGMLDALKQATEETSEAAQEVAAHFRDTSFTPLAAAVDEQVAAARELARSLGTQVSAIGDLAAGLRGQAEKQAEQRGSTEQLLTAANQLRTHAEALGCAVEALFQRLRGA